MTQELLRDRAATAFLVGLELPARQRDGWSAAESLDELERLVDTAGATVVGRQVQSRPAPDVATYIGKGKAEEIELLRRHLEFDFVIFDDELTPVQQRNLERIIDCQVLDRTAVILDIFALRARTREAKLQVELAQLGYRLPRLTGKGVELSRQAGSAGTVFNRGPGETKLEVDRRRIRDRMAALRRELADIQAHRSRLRAERAASAIPVVALTGYTNAGKSTLHRALAGSDVLAEDRLFATLDATTRRVEPAEGEPYLLVDTVGFIHNLPHGLVAAFRSTLEEVTQADLLLHVVDAAHPKRAEQMQTVNQVLAELGAGEKPALVVYNKADLVEPAELEHLLAQTPGAVAVAAALGRNLDGLQAAIQRALQVRREVLEAVIPYAKAAWLSWAHERGRVLAEEHRADGTYVKVELEKGLAGRLRAALGE
ncbi:GTPase HflX [Symbiobacterium terraclitae]|uniref:GTPase HflX n=1 Tax=Symbiobacterium terraclitae TaxID=557451 RepID=UPI0035B51810